jgi:hypothetical protein
VARPETNEKVAARLGVLLGDKLREFPLRLEGPSVRADGAIVVVLSGAAGNVAALRGLREKLQPALKTVLRDLKLGPRFTTVDANVGPDLHVRVELP